MTAGKHQCSFATRHYWESLLNTRTDVYMAASHVAVQACWCLTDCMHNLCSHAVDMNTGQDDTEQDASSAISQAHA